MAYSDFTMSELEEQFGISEQLHPDLLGKKRLKALPPSMVLQQDLEDGKTLPIFSEKAKSEIFIMPILREVWRLQGQRFQLFSGYAFNVSVADRLTGIADYLFSTEKTVTEVKSAVFCVVEAKNRSVIEGVPQAFAEMYAAQIFNEAHHKPTPFVYGAVTNATEWLFLKLENKIAYLDTERYFSDESNLPLLLSALVSVTDFYLSK
jgi:hypothetical protein